MHYPRTYLSILEFEDPYFSPDRAYHWGDEIIPKYQKMVKLLLTRVQTEEEKEALEGLADECFTLSRLCLNAVHMGASIPVIYEGYHLSEYSDYVFDSVRTLNDLIQREMTYMDMSDVDVTWLVHQLQKTDISLCEVIGDHSVWETKEQLYRDARSLPVLECAVV